MQIIPLNLEGFVSKQYFNSWTLFVAICALPSLLLGLWLFAFPESPKFLLECGETEKALEVFKWIYAQNTGCDPDSYPVNISILIYYYIPSCLSVHFNNLRIMSFIRRLQITTLQEKPNSKDKSTRALKLHKRKDLKVLVTEVVDMTKELCKPPHLRNTLLACAIQFGLTSSYYTLMVWFPELFNRFV